MAIIKKIRINGEEYDCAMDGKSAYQIAVDSGFEGTVEEWLESLKGERGEKGEPGDASGTDEETLARITALEGGKLDALAYIPNTTALYARDTTGKDYGQLVDQNNKSGRIPMYTSNTSIGMADGGARLVTSMPLNDYHAVPKKYVVEKVASIKSELEMLGIFYTVLKNAENTPYIKIPTGSMTTAYIESADFDAFHTNGNLVYSGTIDSLEFMDESFATIPNSLISFTAPTYFQVPQGAKWIYLHCGEKVPGDVEWDAGPLVYNGAIYFQVKKG